MRGGRGPWVAAIIAATVLCLTVGAGSASAHGLLTGFADDVYLNPDPTTRAFWYDRTTQENAGLVRLNVDWRLMTTSKPANPGSPSDPAYDFSNLDASVQDAASRGFRIVFTVFDAPKWATGRHRALYAPIGTWKPDPSAYGAFGHALAARYSGSFVNSSGVTLPRVSYYEAWNEPNLYLYLNPAWNGKKAASPTRYRQLLNAFYAGVKGAQRGATVIAGALAPVGGDPGQNIGMRPVTFLRKLFCLGAKHCPKSKFDVLSLHPITNPGLGLNGGPHIHAVSPDDLFIADFHKLKGIVRAARRGHHLGGSKHPPLWASEFWWVTQSPRQPYVIPRKVQARWIEVALYLLWKQGARVAINYNIQDKRAFGSGVFTQKGKPKPSAATFRFPFVVTGTNGHRTGIWTKSPNSGRLAVQRQDKRGKWKTLKTLRVKQGAVVTTKVRAPKSANLRGRIVNAKSLDTSSRRTARITRRLRERALPARGSLAPYVENGR